MRMLTNIHLSVPDAKRHHICNLWKPGETGGGLCHVRDRRADRWRGLCSRHADIKSDAGEQLFHRYDEATRKHQHVEQERACGCDSGNADDRATRLAYEARSEERRVGKECRCRWSTEHEKKKRNK